MKNQSSSLQKKIDSMESDSVLLTQNYIQDLNKSLSNLNLMMTA